MEYVTSIKNMSTELIDAFMASDGEVKAVVLVDGSRDVVPIKEIKYDADRKCIIIWVGYGDFDLDGRAIKGKIVEVNKS